MAAAILVKRFVADVYGVDEASMWPTLAGAEDRVLVDKLFWRGAPPRFSVCVFRHRPKGTTAEPEAFFVKRLLGLPNEWIDFRGGDVFIGETTSVTRLLRPPDLVESQIAAHPVLCNGSRIPVLDAAGGTLAGEGGAFVLTPAPGKTLFARVHVTNGAEPWDIRDDPPSGPGRGRHAVADVRITLGGLSPAGSAVAIVHELGQAELRRVAIGKDGIVVSSRAGGAEEEIARFPGVAALAGLRMETVDGTFRVLLPEGAGWRELYSEPRADTDRAEFSRVRIEVTGGPARIASLELNRDVHYAWAAETTAGPLPIPPDCLFLAGDNPEISTDSRDLTQFGHVPRSALVGIVRAVVLPPGRARIVR